MPVISGLKSQKRAGYYNVMLDGEFWCGVSESQLVLRGLHKGLELTEVEAIQLKDQSVFEKAYAAALRFLSYRIRSCQEIKTQLRRKGYDDEIPAVIERLEAEHYLDDRAFASRWLAMRSEEGRGPRLIAQELKQKGLDSDVISEAIDAYDAESRDAMLLKFVSKKIATGTDEIKIIAAAQRRGWRYYDIKLALESYLDNK